MKPFQRVSGPVAVLDRADVDTDQIIPKQFLKRIERTGFGEFLFYDWRFDGNGMLRHDFELNDPDCAGAKILVAGANFGCGSSREHAPWALLDYGFRAVISTEIADIFRNNSLKNGLLPIVVDETTHQWLLDHPGAELRIDLQSNTVVLPNGIKVSFQIEGFARYCLLNGTDELGFLLQKADAISTFEQARA